MANLDVKNDITPTNQFKPPSLPKISDMRTALLTVNGGDSYPAHRLETMTENDMIYACRVHNLSVTGL